ncbi:MAG: folate-binding protein [Rhodospirillaceae bacterium]|nr:folate-binding protein [Rhodospirillaceae bacterium]MDD9917316.1 folate-binding protein [Rhodospirillaceae bacterium]
MTGLYFERLESRGVVTVGGEDRNTFLQGLISNDIDRVSADRAIWAALLTPQGKYLHDFFVAAIGETIHLDCEGARLMDLGKRLHRFKLRAQVELGIGEGWTVYALFGDGALDALDLPAEAGAARSLGDGIVYTDPRLPEVGARALLPESGASNILESLGFSAADTSGYDSLRLELGLSDGSRDLIVEKSTLLESNFDELHGVDWDKGCYMGQELTARTKYRALVRKRLMPVRIDGPTPELGTPLMAGDKEIGEMRSGLDTRGLALIRLERLEEADTDALIAGDAQVFPEKPIWARY